MKRFIIFFIGLIIAFPAGISGKTYSSAYKKAEKYLLHEEYAKSYNEFKKLCESGDNNACYMLMST